MIAAMPDDRMDADAEAAMGDDDDDDAPDDGAPLDPTALDPFERGAVLPTVAERNVGTVLARAAVIAAWLVVRLTVLLVLVDAAVELGRVAWDVDGGFTNKLGNGALRFFSGHVEEIRWLSTRVPIAVTVMIVFAAALAVMAMVASAGEVLSVGVDTVREAGSRVGALAAAAQADLVDRLIAAVAQPIGKWREVAARAAVGLISGGIVAALFARNPPSMFLDLVYVEESFSFLLAARQYLVLGVAWLAALYLTLQAVIQLVQIARIVRERKPPPMAPWTARAVDGATTLRFLHWSDLHVTPYDDALTTDLKAVGGNQALRALVAAAARTDEPVIITGDSTDAGRSREWRALFEILAPIVARVVLVPGNHDLNIVDPLRRSVIGDEAGRGRALRQVRMLAALARVQGERAWVLDDGEVVTLATFVARRRGLLARFYAAPLELHPTAIDAHYRAAFPMAVELPGGFVVHVFDSNEAAATALSNAFGMIEAAALARYRTLRGHFAARPQLVALHHHLAYPGHVTERGLLHRAMARFIVLRNTREVVAAIADRATVVLHGHKHIGHEGRLGEHLDIVSARSATLGDAFRGETTPGGRRVTVASADDGGTRLVGCADWPGVEDLPPA